MSGLDTCLMCRGPSLMCRGQGLMCRDPSLMCRGQSLMCRDPSLMFRKQSLVVPFFYEVNALWRERSMT